MTTLLLAATGALAQGGGAPPAPTNLSCTPSGSSVQLDWNDVTGATSYNVYRRTGTGPFVLIGTSTTSAFEDTTVAPGQTYDYRVTALRGVSESAPSATCTVTAIPYFPSLVAVGAAALGVVVCVGLIRRRRGAS